ncbi:MAG: MalY/PatB family protein [Candidatus Merdivicinus sp.]
MEHTEWFDSFPDRHGTSSSKWDECSADTIPMFVADMDFRSPQCVIDALIRRAEHGVFGYSFAGDDFYKAFCEWEERIHGCSVSKEEILLSPGVITGLQWSIQAITPQDGAMIMLPSYPPFMSVPRNLDKPLYPVTLCSDSGKWLFNWEEFETMAARPDVNTFILCNPHNPTGRMWTREELCQMLTICRQHQVTVFSDEIHGDIIMPGGEFVSVLSLPPEIAGDAVVLTAPSKTFNLPGLQTSCIVVRNPEMRKKIADLMGKNRIPSPTFMGITAATAAYQHGEEWMREMNAYVAENFRVMEEFFARELPEISFVRPQATYLAWLDCRKTGLSCEELNQRLLDAGVSLGVGTGFGKDAGEGFMRLTAACPRSLLLEALCRIKKAFR